MLIVDDEREIRLRYAEFFKGKGFEVLEANDGVEGLDIATREPEIDIIFTGIIMPRMDGFQLIKSLKEYTETAEIPVVVNSHLGREGDRKKMLELGASDFIVQGITSLNDVLKRIFQAIGKEAYVLGIDTSKHDIERFAEENKLPPGLKCPECFGELALLLKYQKENKFIAGVFCPECERKKSP